MTISRRTTSQLALGLIDVDGLAVIGSRKVSQVRHDLGEPGEITVLVIQLCASYICGTEYPALYLR
jgi:hypothetical protein